MVVLAIIGVLLSLLMPSITKGVQMAKKTECRAAMKNIHNAILVYANNNNQVLPGGSPTGPYGNAHGNHLFGVQNMRVTGHTKSIMRHLQSILAGYEIVLGQTSHIPDGGRLPGTTCTVNREESTDIHSPVWFLNNQMDKKAGGTESPWGFKGVDFLELVEPEDSWIITDYDQEHPFSSPSDGWFDRSPVERVHSTWNILYLDGSVQDLKDF